MATIEQPRAGRQAQAFLARLDRDRPQIAAFIRAQIDGAEPEPTPNKRRQAPKPSAPAPRARKARPARSRQERARYRAKRAQERDRAYLEKLTARVKTHGGTPDHIVQIPIKVWTMAAQVMADHTGRAARIYLRKLRNRPAAGGILEASRGTGDAAADRSWSDQRTRRIAALGLVLAELARPARGRSGKWAALVMGIPRRALCALLRNPFDRRTDAAPSVSALFGTHRPGGQAGTQCGYFHPLRAAGVVYRQQMRPEMAEPCELFGSSGYATNRYWLTTPAPYVITDAAHQARAFDLADLANADAHELANELQRERRAAQPPD